MTSRATEKVLELPGSTHAKDLILGSILSAIAALENLRGPISVLAVGALGALSLGWRRRAPLIVAGVVSAANIAVEVMSPAGSSEEGSFLGGVAVILIAIYSVAAYARSLHGALTGGALIALGANFDLVLGGLGTDDFWPFRLMFLAGAWLSGRVLHGRELQVGHLEEQQEARTKAAIADEKARLARELHDVIAHNVSVMVVQAGAAQEVLARAPQKASESLQNIQRTGRETVTELRRLLGILRVGEEESLTAPQPGLEELEALVARVRDTGLPVELKMTGAPRKLPVSIDLSAYRIVQEGLTNTLKHASATAVCVQVSYGEGDLTIEIIDNGRGSSNGSEGHGLIGVRERVAMFNGTIDFGSSPGGGFRLRVKIPLDDKA